MLRRHLLALTLLLVVPAGAWRHDWVPWTPLGPSHRRPEVPDTPWSRTVDRLWNATRAQVAFCVGDGREPALALLAASFPWPLPAGPTSEPVCASNQGLETFLCRPAEIEQYVRVSGFGGGLATGARSGLCRGPPHVCLCCRGVEGGPPAVRGPCYTRTRAAAP